MGQGCYDSTVLSAWYKDMLRIRYFEKKIDFLFTRNLIHGTAHLCIGQEAVAVGVCSVLKKEDLVVSNHRGHGHGIAKGLEVKKLMAELMGKKTGYCSGKGGTQHFSCFEKGFLGANGITGGGIPIATGAALAIKMKKRKEVVVSFFGDGAASQGVFHESLNMASLWKVPVIYVCENNLYAMSTPIGETICAKNIADRAGGYCIPSKIVDGNNIFNVIEAAKEAIDYVREGNGPFFIECKTYRWMGHSKSDMRLYRTREEERLWKEKCPINMLRNHMLIKRMYKETELDKIDKEIRNEIEMAYTFSKDSKELQPKELYKSLFA